MNFTVIFIESYLFSQKGRVVGWQERAQKINNKITWKTKKYRSNINFA